MIHVDGKLGISFEGQVLVLYSFVPFVPHWPEHGSWQEGRRFISEKEWHNSQYSKLITDPYLQEMVMWHWIDQIPTLVE